MPVSARLSRLSRCRSRVTHLRWAWPLPATTLTAPIPAVSEQEPRTIGEHLKKAQIQRGLQQRDVAAAIEVHRKTLDAWQNRGGQPARRHWPTVLAFLDYDPHGEPTSFLERLEAAGRRHGLTEQEMAKALDVDVDSLRRWRQAATGPIWRRLQQEVEGKLDALLRVRLVD